MLRENHLLQLLLGLVVFAQGANLPTHLPLPDRLLHVFNDITYRILLHCKRPALRQYGLMLILGKDVQVQVESLGIVNISHLPGQIQEVLQHIIQLDLQGEL